MYTSHENFRNYQCSFQRMSSKWIFFKHCRFPFDAVKEFLYHLFSTYAKSVLCLLNKTVLKTASSAVPSRGSDELELLPG